MSLERTVGERQFSGTNQGVFGMFSRGKVSTRALLACLTIGLTAVSWRTLDAADEKPVPATVAVFDLHGNITDQPPVEDPLFGNIHAQSLQSLLTRLKKAGDDDKIAAVLILLNEVSLQPAQIEELRQVLKVVKAKKPIYTHADSVKTGSYALISCGSRVAMAPTGDAWITGLYMEGLYVRGLLDMIGVQPDFLTCGKYKSAAEMFMRKDSSPEASEMNNWLIDSLYKSIVTMISESRDVTPDVVEGWMDRGIYSAEAAQQAKLIDVVESREELLTFLKKTHGATVKLDKNYGKKTAPNIDLENPFAMLQLWAQLLNDTKPTKSTKNAVAIVHVDGPIMLGRQQSSLLSSSEGAFSETIRKALDKVADEPRIRAVVLRVNSPGGSAVASEIILKAVRNVQTQKPVIVSMGNVAASGGYYVSSRASRIFADATTITGSIGVVAGKLATDQMWQRIGVNFTAVQRGKNAGLMQSSKAWTEAEKNELQGWMDEIYGVFKSHVVEGREGKLTKPIDDIAGGRVYTGAQALELGLIDEIGSLNDAIAYAAKEVKLEDYEIRTFPEQKNFLEQLMSEIADKKQDDKRLSTGIWSVVEPVLKGIDPQRVSMIQSALLQLDCIQQERVMLTAPIFLLSH
ncbi:signal peptide peptidase SppA [Planctomicrobium sp. SH661]|uniref:signal peptide peptidase SppA n=1 Tax=Planctomicrobium sp. SH661 TaxID=3448124 RepID=UPI003F5B8323